MSYKAASKKDEEDLKAYQAKAAAATATTSSTPATTTKKALKGLVDELNDRGVTMDSFALGTEEFRKRVLKEDYDDFRAEYQWQYGTFCKDGMHWASEKGKCVSNE